jgi:hypothetical protein
MDNPEIREKLGTQNTGRRQPKQQHRKLKRSASLITPKKQEMKPGVREG